MYSSRASPSVLVCKRLADIVRNMKTHKKSLKLHIGFTKTGSTSIQAFLRENESALAAEGIYYPNLFNEHSGQVSVFGYITSQHDLKFSKFVRGRFELYTEQDAERFRAEFETVFADRITGSSADTIVLSCELMARGFNHVEHFRCLKQFLEAWFYDIEIIAYIRAQEDLIPSRLSQSTKLGNSVPLDQFITAANNDYLVPLQRWSDTFGAERLNVRLFGKAHFINGNLIEDFYSMIGGDELGALQMPQRVNPALSAEAIDFLQGFNKHIPYLTDAMKRNPVRGNILGYMGALSKDGQAVKLSIEQLNTIREQYAASNEKVREIFYPDRSELFSVNKSKLGSNPPLTADRAVEIAAYLWREQQETIETLRERVRKQQKRIDKLQGKD